MPRSSRSGFLRTCSVLVVLLAADAGAGAVQLVSGRGIGSATRARASGDPSVLEGTFAPPRVGASNAAAVEAADLDGDGWLDLVVLAGNQLRVLFSNGVPGFGFREEAYDLIASTEELVLADLDQDSDLDAVVSTAFFDLLVLENLGDGRFGPAATLSCFGSGGELAARDVDGDADLDLLCGDPIGRNLCVYRNDGDGSFPDLVQLSISASQQVTGYAFCDVDQDADPDIVVAARMPSLLVLENLGAGVFVPGASIPVPGLFVPTDLAGTHLDADGREDLVVLEYNQVGLPIARLHALLATGSGAFVQQGPYGLSEGLFAAGNLVVADADLDGDADVLVPEGGAERLEVRSNDGQGGLSEARILATAGNAADVEADDFDRDGAVDLLVLNARDEDLWLLRGDGLGRFFSRLPIGAGIASTALAAADFDQDGDFDVATTGGQAFVSQATTYRNDGRAGFPEIVTYTFPLSGTPTTCSSRTSTATVRRSSQWRATRCCASSRTWATEPSAPPSPGRSRSGSSKRPGSRQRTWTSMATSTWWERSRRATRSRCSRTTAAARSRRASRSRRVSRRSTPPSATRTPTDTWTSSWRVPPHQLGPCRSKGARGVGEGASPASSRCSKPTGPAASWRRSCSRPERDRSR